MKQYSFDYIKDIAIVWRKVIILSNYVYTYRRDLHLFFLNSDTFIFYVKNIVYNLFFNLKLFLLFFCKNYIYISNESMRIWKIFTSHFIKQLKMLFHLWLSIANVRCEKFLILILQYFSKCLFNSFVFSYLFYHIFWLWLYFSQVFTKRNIWHFTI